MTTSGHEKLKTSKQSGMINSSKKICCVTDCACSLVHVLQTANIFSSPESVKHIHTGSGVCTCSAC